MYNILNTDFALNSGRCVIYLNWIKRGFQISKADHFISRTVIHFETATDRQIGLVTVGDNRIALDNLMQHITHKTLMGKQVEGTKNEREKNHT